MRSGLLQGYNVQTVAALAGLTPPMVNYLCRQKLIQPSLSKQRGRGRPLSYSFGDIVMLRVIARLLNSGVSVERVRKAFTALRKHHPAITPTTLPARYLITDGKSVFLSDGKAQLEELDGRGQMSFAFVLELSTIRDEVLQEAKKRELRLRSA
ncbi:MAG: MerR family transcriptional regulator [Sphingosinicella sp.]|nr:MerR family transcriptional regulator [Sphingosinicella sp.]